MAPKSRISGGSNMAAKKRGKQKAAERRSKLSATSAGTVANDEDMESSSSSFIPDPEIILDLEQSHHAVFGNQRPQYPPLEIEEEEEEEEDGTAPQPVTPTTPPMMPWEVHPSVADMNSLGSSVIDQEQRRVLQALSEETSSYIGTTSDVRSSTGSDASFATLYNLGVEWWRDDLSRTFVDFPDIGQVSGSNPYRCLHGRCSTKLKVFTCPSALWKHLAFHIPKGMRPFVCLECPIEPVRRDFVLPKDLLRHFLEKHKDLLSDFFGEQTKPHLDSAKCDICETVFSRKGGLKRHQDKFDGSCGNSKRSRRKSAPAATSSSGHPPLAAPVDQATSQMVASHRLSTSTASSSIISDPLRLSAQSSHRRQTTSTATGFSVHFSPDMGVNHQAAEPLPHPSHIMPRPETLPIGYEWRLHA